MADNYWAERLATAQSNLTEKSVRKVERQLAKYYEQTAKNIIGQFEKTYLKVMVGNYEGVKPTPADLYKLDSYWKMLAECKAELEKFGNKQQRLLGKSFINQYQQIYEVISLPTDLSFGKIDKSALEQIINQIWCSDGESWSSRIWKNIERLQDTLTEGLLDCLVAGKSPNALKHELQKRFNVSFSNADMIVRTEMSHLQTQAAQKRYQDSGIEWVEVLADKDERRCKVCGKLHQQRFPVNGQMPVPAHPRCRCCVIPVVGDYNEQMIMDGF